ncbi:hypothetical protein K0M31_017678 [Melipona bicolor]|uniref:EF-hand domain-containing protein n=1 Tax=Melipona bicolor TaxID=60889 RepID=A0AA40G5S7_9HYME|nr:hypothetical protein K0M31_017678 [Melipona bicolor]
MKCAGDGKEKHEGKRDFHGESMLESSFRLRNVQLTSESRSCLIPRCRGLRPFVSFLPSTVAAQLTSPSGKFRSQKRFRAGDRKGRDRWNGDGNVSFEEFVEIVSNIGANETAPTDQDQEEQELRDAFRVCFAFYLLPSVPWNASSFNATKLPARKTRMVHDFAERPKARSFDYLTVVRDACISAAFSVRVICHALFQTVLTA